MALPVQGLLGWLWEVVVIECDEVCFCWLSILWPNLFTSPILQLQVITVLKNKNI